MFTATPPNPPPPRTLTAVDISRGHQTDTPNQGSLLRRGEIGFPRVFANGRDGIALGGSQEDGGVTFAARTTDGGRTWRVGSPALWTASADAPNDVSAVAVAGTRTDIVYGGENVTVSGDSGRTWFRVYPPGWVTAVIPGQRGIAFEDQIINSSGRVTRTVLYVSRDGGRHWSQSNTQWNWGG